MLGVTNVAVMVIGVALWLDELADPEVRWLGLAASGIAAVSLGLLAWSL